MDTLAYLAPQMLPEDSLLKADVEDAYYDLRIKLCDRNKLLFRLAGRLFRPRALKCDMSPAPHLGTKFSRLLIQELRSRGHRLISYQYDIKVASRASNKDRPATPEDAAQVGQEIS
jgi:hypothetical protein